MLCVSPFSHSFIYDAWAGLGEGFDIIKGPYGHDGDLEHGTLHRVSLSDSLSSFSPSVAFLFIYLYNNT